MDALQIIWQALNSPLGVAIVAGLILWGLNKLYDARPAWAKYEGAIVGGIKLAEKAIPDDTPNKAAAKLDAALQYAVKAFEEVERRRAKPKEIAELKDGVQVMHAELEAAGTLKKGEKT